MNKTQNTGDIIAKSLSNQTEYLQAMLRSYKVRYRKDGVRV